MTRYRLMAALLFIPLVFLADLGLTVIHACLFQEQIGAKDILPRLCDRVRPGMRRAEIEQQIAGFRETRIESREEGYVVAYGYWFGVIPPLGRLEFKLIGELQVTFSSGDLAEKCDYWYN